jgi:putative NADH-flavin reductase
MALKVVLFGASGGTGREVVRQALAQGHAVTAFVRDPVKLAIEHSGLTVVKGDVADYAAVERAVRDQDAAIVALGASTLLKRDPTLVDGVRCIASTMQRTGVRRLVYLSFLGVRGGRSQLSFLGRTIVAPLLLRNVVADHEAKEAIVRQSGLDWTIVRPPRLTNGPPTAAYRSGEDIEARAIVPAISRADVAHFMLKQLTDDAYRHKAPGLMH